MDTLAQTPAPMAAAPHAIKRRWRNYLLNARFQLKFTAYIVAITVCISAWLGFFLWRGSLSLMHEAELAVEARSRAAQTSQDLSTATLNNKLLEHMNDPDFERQLAEEAQQIDAQYEAEKAAILQQKAELGRRQQWTWVILVGCFAGFVILLSLATIVATHKVAGPLFRIKRMAQEVGDGRYVAPTHALRQGDELQDVFDSMTSMIQGLRQKQQDDLNLLSASIERIRQSAANGTAVAELQQLEARMRARLGDTAR